MKMLVSLKLPWCLDLIEIHDQNGVLFFSVLLKVLLQTNIFTLNWRETV